ncbi:MAG: hypothetical protein ACOC6B_04170 [Thermodesulfobacteriota bacterium]
MIDNGIGDERNLIILTQPKELALQRRLIPQPPAQNTRKSVPDGKRALECDTHWEKGLFIDTYA